MAGTGPAASISVADQRLKRGPAANGRRQGALIEIIEFAADRNAMGQPCHFDLRAVQEISNVVRGALALDRRAQRENDLRDGRVARALHQSFDRKIVRSDAVEWR